MSDNMFNRLMRLFVAILVGAITSIVVLCVVGVFKELFK